MGLALHFFPYITSSENSDIYLQSKLRQGVVWNDEKMSHFEVKKMQKLFFYVTMSVNQSLPYKDNDLIHVSLRL